MGCSAPHPPASQPCPMTHSLCKPAFPKARSRGEGEKVAVT